MYPVVPPDVLRFQPEIGGPADWSVSPIELPLQCPDGEPGRFYVLYPDRVPAGPMPAAVLFHSGSFDYVYAPEPGAPLEGTHFAEPSRLDSEWAVHQVFVTLGMYPEQDATESHDGRLAVALAEAGVAVLLPSNCWGDLWADQPGAVDNEFGADLFSRQGRAAAEWSWQLLADPTFGPLFDVQLPFTPDPTSLYAIGLGEGGRAVMELSSIDHDADGSPDYAIAGAVVDSPPDDLRVYFDDAGLFASTVEGLSRIFPAGPAQAESGSAWAAPLPDRFGYLYSTGDPRLPTELNEAAVERLTAAGAWVDASEDVRHVRVNGGADPALAERVVQFLTTGATR